MEMDGLREKTEEEEEGGRREGAQPTISRPHYAA
jgi:hypothetical protein